MPAVVDLAAMRDAMVALGGDPQKINPLIPVDLVIDHSVQVDAFGHAGRLRAQRRARVRAQRRALRLPALGLRRRSTISASCRPAPASATRSTSNTWPRWSGPRRRATARSPIPTRWSAPTATPRWSTAWRVLGWGVGGIEAEAAMLGQPVSMLIPEVVGFKLTGRLPEGATATDLVLTVTQMLRKKGVVGKFVEFFGPGLGQLPLADRATIGNMAPEYGATCGFFPIDADHARLPAADRPRPGARSPWSRPTPRRRACGATTTAPSPLFTDTLELDLGTVEPSLAGPKRPAGPGRRCQGAQGGLRGRPARAHGRRAPSPPSACRSRAWRDDLGHGDVVIAAITSCTNTSNPGVMIAAGLVAQKAGRAGPDAQALGQDLARARLPRGHRLPEQGRPDGRSRRDRLRSGRLWLHHLHRQFGPACRTRSRDAVDRGTAGGRGGARPATATSRAACIAQVKANYLASPPLVVAYALAGSMRIDITTRAARHRQRRQAGLSAGRLADARLRSRQAIQSGGRRAQCSRDAYADVFKGDEHWAKIGGAGAAMTYDWDDASTYVRLPPYFESMPHEPAGRCHDITGARILALLGDSITTDHISPAGSIAKTSPAADYLMERQVRPQDFNSLRRAARQPRGHDARHLRQHPHQERDARRQGGRLDQADAGRRRYVDLRCRHGIPGAGRAAGGHRRQGIRHRLVARLGGQGHRPARASRR